MEYPLKCSNFALWLRNLIPLQSARKGITLTILNYMTDNVKSINISDDYSQMKDITKMDDKTLIGKVLADGVQQCGMVLQGKGHHIMTELAQRLEVANRNLECKTAPNTNRDHARASFYANQMENFVNDFGLDRDGFANDALRWHRTNQQSFIGLLLHCVKKFATEGTTDGRNKASVEACRKIYEFMEKEDIPTRFPMI